MDILISKAKLTGAYKYIVDGWVNAFKHLGHTARLWDGKKSSIGRPDIFIGCSGHKQEFPRGLRRHTTVIIHANPYGEPIPTQEQRQDINWTIAQSPDYLICYALPHQIKKYWNKWPVKVLSMPTGGDTIRYKHKYDNNYACDIAYVGQLWPYKETTISEWLMPVINKYHSAFIYGSSPGWTKLTNKYKGQLTADEEVRLLSSAKIVPCISEAHTQKYGVDIPERIWKAPLCGAMVVCDSIKDIDKHVDPAIFNVADSPAEYMHLIDYYLENEIERVKKAKLQREAIVNSHTYIHRISSLLKAIK